MESVPIEKHARRNQM